MLDNLECSNIRDRNFLARILQCAFIENVCMVCFFFCTVEKDAISPENIVDFICRDMSYMANFKSISLVNKLKINVKNMTR